MDKETFEKLKRIYDKLDVEGRVLMEKEFPELRESEDERIRKEIISFLKEGKPYHCPNSVRRQEWVTWLEKQKELKTIQWTGDNLKEVTKFTGLSPEFNNWFKSWDEYESYVHSHNDVFKLFFEDGSHYEVPKGAWIIRTLDGYNVASRSKYVEKQKSLPPTSSGAKYYFDEWFQQQLTPKYFDAFLAGIEFNKKEQKSIEWSEEDEEIIEDAIKIINCYGNIITEQNESNRVYLIADKLKSLKPQQRQEWSDEDESMFTRCLGVLGKCYMGELPTKVEEELVWLKSIKNKVVPQEKVGWSKEDENELGRVIYMMEQLDLTVPWSDCYNWLKSLKPQSKHEWTEEDTDRLNSIIGTIGYCKSEWTDNTSQDIFDSDIKWLESLKPQKHWRPSKEQMEAFEWCVKQYKDCHFKPNHEIIESLYENLKKL